jgi:hypothetical protein
MIRAIRQQFDSESFAAAGRAVGERALMRAVLEDAIHCLAAETGPTGKRSRLAAEARTWVADDDLQWPFSFANLCDALGFNCETLRARLLTSAPILLPLDTDAVAAIEVVGRSAAPGPAKQDINDMIRAGCRLRAVAAHFGISISKASILSAGLASRMKAERDDEIRGLERQGWTHRAIARHFGLSRVRVGRICAHRDPTDGERTVA